MLGIQDMSLQRLNRDPSTISTLEKCFRHTFLRCLGYLAGNRPGARGIGFNDSCVLCFRHMPGLVINYNWSSFVSLCITI